MRSCLTLDEFATAAHGRAIARLSLAPSDDGHFAWHARQIARRLMVRMVEGGGARACWNPLHWRRGCFVAVPGPTANRLLAALTSAAAAEADEAQDRADCPWACGA